MNLVSSEHRLKILKSEKLLIINEDDICYDSLKFKLKSHQICMVNNMIHLENEVIDKKIKSFMGICADDVGSGKSFCILALISNNTPLLKDRVNNVSTYGLVNVYEEFSTCTQVDVNLLVIPHVLVKQWEAYISTYTKFSFTTFKTKCPLDTSVDILICPCTKYSELACLHKNILWNRIFYDEVDSIKLPSCKQLMSKFTWFITNSLENLLFPSGTYFAYHSVPNSHRKFIKKFYVNGIRHNGFIKNIFRDLDDDIVERIVLKNDDNAVKKSFDVPEYIVVKIQCKSPIYLNILENSISKEAIDLLNAGDFNSAIEKLGCSIGNDETIIQAVSRSIHKKINLLDINIKFYEEENESEKINKLLTKKNDLLQRLDNIEHNIKNYESFDCPICFDTVKSPMATVECCKKIFCFQCITRCLPTCPMCRSLITREDLYVMYNSVKIQYKPSKLEALFKILENKGKFLIFSAYENSIINIGNSLIRKGVVFKLLQGNVMKIDNTIKEYKEGNLDVLVLNANNTGSGLNLENTTDLIFFHKMTPELERQIIGRAQRMGRKNQLTIHFLYYENEFKI